MVIVDTEVYSSFKEKEHLISVIKRKYQKVKLAFTDNMIIYQYNDGKKNI